MHCGILKYESCVKGHGKFGINSIGGAEEFMGYTIFLVLK